MKNIIAICKGYLIWDAILLIDSIMEEPVLSSLPTSSYIQDPMS